MVQREKMDTGTAIYSPTPGHKWIPATLITIFATLILGLILLWVIQKSFKFYQNVKAVGNHPGYRTILWHRQPLSYFLPPIPGLTGGTNFDIVACVAAFPARIEFLIADSTFVKDITAACVSFPKPLIMQLHAIRIWDTWKKYRKISGPAFSDRNNRLVWEQSLKITGDLINTVWKNKDVVEVEHAVDVTLPIALNVIGADMVLPPGHEVPFRDVLRLAMRLTPKWAKVRAAFDELEAYMLEMIENQRTAATREERHDLFGSFLDANDGEGESLIGRETRLTDQELLALYPDQQEILHTHVKSITPDGRNPVSFAILLHYHYTSLLKIFSSVIYETLRLFPPGTSIPKMSSEDTVLVSTNEAGERKTVPVPQGAMVRIDVVGLHYSPRYWKNPEMFSPSRFLDDWPREAFMPFSQGARACIGRKFFETEAIAVLTMIISKYKITVREKPRETFGERKERILKSRHGGLFLTPVKTPLVFTKRE
ncbi:cytochrome P450 [Armillaria gallica]|uniref:Cytochrome P450 n=1 Tax=Armillaria gallica TaxID=47427 RepID=A0A2H3DBS2_ARMGA|nr:cytochrome P450 [Armillaria gallica]